MSSTRHASDPSVTIATMIIIRGHAIGLSFHRRPNSEIGLMEIAERNITADHSWTGNSCERTRSHGLLLYDVLQTRCIVAGLHRLCAVAKGKQTNSPFPHVRWCTEYDKLCGKALYSPWPEETVWGSAFGGAEHHVDEILTTPRLADDSPALRSALPIAAMAISNWATSPEWFRRHGCGGSRPV
ncbi:hypothetical protein VDGL01_00587 [Verticillium dahliae]